MRNYFSFWSAKWKHAILP